MTTEDIEVLTLEIKRLNLKLKALENKQREETTFKIKETVKIKNSVSISIGNRTYTKKGVTATIIRFTKCFVVVGFERRILFPSEKGKSEVRRKSKNLQKIEALRTTYRPQ